MPPKKNKNNPQQPIDPYQQRLDKEKARVQREIEAWAKKQREEIVDHVHEQNTTLDDILKALKANYNPSNQVKSPEQSGDPKRNNVSNNLASQDQGNYHEFPELGVTHYDRTIEFIQVMFEPCNNQQQENTNTSSTRNHHQPQIGPSQQSANSPTNGATLSAESAARLRRRRLVLSRKDLFVQYIWSVVF